MTTTRSVPRAVVLAALVVLLALWGLGGAGSASAHPLSTTAVLLDVGDTTVTGQLQLPVDRLAIALEDPDLTPAAAVAPAELATLRDYVADHTAARGADGTAWSVDVTGGRIAAVDGVDHLVLDLTLTPPVGETAPTGLFTFSYDAIVEHLLSHQILVSARPAGATDYSTVGLINWQDHDLAVDGFAPADPAPAGVAAGFATAVHLGIEHISGGADHLLFLITLLLPAPLMAARGRWVRRPGLRRSSWRVLHVVTAFAVGHSITLALAALGYVHVDSRVVESLIAVSILASAVHAMKPLVPGGEAAIAAGFGLVHGLAFAAVIDDLGLDRGSLVVQLLGFNLGIELTQLIVVALVMPSLLLLSRTRLYPAVRLTGAAISAALALGWLAERTGLLSSNVLDGMGELPVARGLAIAGGLAALAVVAFTVRRWRVTDAPVATARRTGSTRTLVRTP
ncbi:HupE/UreJ family protein [Geodermatophilaceae bacterium NBWT11]|nr:HupE/UreJ family protein [Geodermatophilaceae bacterium NBWT11]